MEELKKYGLFSILGVVLILSLVGAFIPDAREYIGNMMKIVLNLVPGFAN